MAALIPSASASGSGTMTLAGPSTNSNQTITIPDATGTMMVSGNMPAFSAYGNTNQTISNATWTKIIINVKEFDTATCFNTSNYRFTPNVAGYYFITVAVAAGNTANGVAIAIYKNGSASKTVQNTTLNPGFGNETSGSALIYANGTTDYFESYCFQGSGTSTTTFGDSTAQYFQAFLARAA